MTLYSKECLDKILVKIARADKMPLGLGQGRQNAGDCYIYNQPSHFNTALTKYFVTGIKVSFSCDISFCSVDPVPKLTGILSALVICPLASCPGFLSERYHSNLKDFIPNKMFSVYTDSVLIHSS